MTNRIAPFATIAISVAGLAAILTGCSNAPSVETPAPETVSNVQVIAARTSKQNDSLEAIGTVRAAQTTQVASQMMGIVLDVRVHEGDRVQSGQVLAMIEDAQPRASVAQATAAATAADQEFAAADSDLALSESTLKRYQQLYDKKSVSPQEFDEISARRQSSRARRDMAGAQQAEANAALTQARVALSYAQIRAPFDGVVTDKKVDAGTLASPGLPLFTVEDTRNYRLEVAVDENNVHLVRLRQSVPVMLEALGDATISGNVSEIVPAADPASRSFLVKVALPTDARIRSGLFGKVSFVRGQRAAMMIPRSAIAQRGQLQGVYVIDAKQIAAMRFVALGKSVGDQVEVLSGLQEGEKVIAYPGSREFGGKQIKASQ